MKAIKLRCYKTGRFISRAEDARLAKEAAAKLDAMLAARKFDANYLPERDTREFFYLGY